MKTGWMAAAFAVGMAATGAAQAALIDVSGDRQNDDGIEQISLYADTKTHEAQFSHLITDEDFSTGLQYGDAFTEYGRVGQITGNYSLQGGYAGFYINILVYEKDSCTIMGAYECDPTVPLTIEKFAKPYTDTVFLAEASGEYFLNMVPVTAISPIDPVALIPIPSSAPLLGAALLALGAVGYGMNRRSRSRPS